MNGTQTTNQTLLLTFFVLIQINEIISIPLLDCIMMSNDSKRMSYRTPLALSKANINAFANVEYDMDRLLPLIINS